MPATAKFTKAILLTIDPETYEHIKELAWRERLSMSAYFRTMIAKEFQRLDHKKPSA